MKLKKYSKGGKYKMYQDGGPVKPKKKMIGPEKEPEKDLLTEKLEMLGNSKEEKEQEKAYLERRKQAEREYKQAIKEGATPEQATKIAEKYLSQGGKMYLKGGQVKSYNKGGKVIGPKRAPKVTKLSDSYIKQQEKFAKTAYKSYMDGLKKTGKKFSPMDEFKAKTAAISNMYNDLDYGSLSDSDKKFVDKHKKTGMIFSDSDVKAPIKYPSDKYNMGGVMKLKKK